MFVVLFGVWEVDLRDVWIIVVCLVRCWMDGVEVLGGVLGD